MKNNQLIIYQTEDGKVKIETHFENETVWLNIDPYSRAFSKISFYNTGLSFVFVSRPDIMTL